MRFGGVFALKTGTRWEERGEKGAKGGGGEALTCEPPKGAVLGRSLPFNVGE